MQSITSNRPELGSLFINTPTPCTFPSLPILKL
uniref:Carboxyl-terminal-processing protease n=1 Tax=Arundo donax TaxID=35708 RepID=A0A0A8YKM0_ARUDO